MQTDEPDYFTAYHYVKLTRDGNGVLTVSLHTNGGPCLMTAQTHTEFVEAFYRISQDRANKIVILTGAGGDFITDVDWSSWGTLAHEVMHPALQHHTRRGDRDQKRWNMACDYAINPMLIDAGLALPKDVLLDARFTGMSAEEIYNRLDLEYEGSSEGESQQNASADPTSEDAAKGKQGGEEASNQPIAPESPGGIGQVLDAAEAVDSPSIDEQKREWQIAVQQAENVARPAGKMPAGAKRSLEAAREASVDWREFLRRAWSETIPADYSWVRPNRRHIWAGLYLPGVTSEGVGRDRDRCRLLRIHQRTTTRAV